MRRRRDMPGFSPRREPPAVERETEPPPPDADATGDAAAPTLDTEAEGSAAALESPVASARELPVDTRGEEDLEAQLTNQRDRYLRLAADFENYRRRMAKDHSEAGARGQANLVRQMIDALDDLARFAHLDPQSTDPATVVEGVDMVERKLHGVLNKAGLEIINPVNETFDPERHEAVSTEPAASPEDDHVVARVYQPGYLFRGQLLRPARVVVRQWTG